MSSPLNQMLMQPSPIGEVMMSSRDIAGPVAYVTGGVAISANYFALLTFKNLLSSHNTQDGLYFARFILPRGAGFPTATVVWYTASTGAQVANGTNLSASFLRVIAMGN